MDTEEKKNIIDIATILDKLSEQDKEKALWVMQGMILAGQTKKNA